ncbi:MAG: hypothetical protein ABIB46_03525, partial [bacterium]
MIINTGMMITSYNKSTIRSVTFSSNTGINCYGDLTVDEFANITFGNDSTINSYGTFLLNEGSTIDINPTSGKATLNMYKGAVINGEINIQPLGTGTTAYLTYYYSKSKLNINGSLYVAPVSSNNVIIQAPTISVTGSFMIDAIQFNTKVTLNSNVENTGIISFIGINPNPTNINKPDETSYVRNIITGRIT